MPIEQTHVENALMARTLYLDSMRAADATADWRFAIKEARRLAVVTLRATAMLSKVAEAIEANGSHCLVLRQVLAPPMSQDQFALVCPKYSKGRENNGTKFSPDAAAAIAAAIVERLDLGVVGWRSRGQAPDRKQVETFLRVASTLIGLQRLSTARRKRLAFEQEQAVVEMLLDDGWTRLPSTLIDTRAMVPTQHFMHKTRFATASAAPQEVDIACGLRGSYVLAMECKVTNDQTNSVKRVNDVLKKASAWKTHWGSFVETAALLQGVISPKDVQRLTDAGVHVFWSHDLGAFKTWVDARL